MFTFPSKHQAFWTIVLALVAVAIVLRFKPVKKLVVGGAGAISAVDAA